MVRVPPKAEVVSSNLAGSAIIFNALKRLAADSLTQSEANRKLRRNFQNAEWSAPISSSGRRKPESVSKAFCCHRTSCHSRPVLGHCPDPVIAAGTPRRKGLAICRSIRRCVARHCPRS
jgi:hypothetical protein